MATTELTERTIASFPGLFARASGKRRATVVFLHGAFGDHTVFRNYLGHFSAAGFDGVAVARRGRLGVGPQNAKGVTIEDYLDDTRAVLDVIGGNPILIGHSLGGLLAQVLAAEGRCAAAVLVAPAPPGMLTAQPSALPTFLPNMPKIMLGLPFTVPAGGCRKIALNRIDDESERARIHGTLNPESGLVYRSMMFGSIKVDASKVKCPIFVVGGEDDRIVSAALNKSTAKHYGAELLLLPQHAHWLPEEPGWEVACDAMIGWLSARTPRDDVRAPAVC